MAASRLSHKISDLAEEEHYSPKVRYRCTIEFKSKVMEEEYVDNSLHFRFPRARRYTFGICSMVLIFMGVGAYDHFTRHELYHWVTISRFLVASWMLLYMLILLLTMDSCTKKCCCGARISKSWLGRNWQRVLAINTLLACTYVAVAQSTIMEDAIFFVMNRCEITDLREILDLPFQCTTEHNVTHDIEFEEMFPNWHLKNLNATYMIYTAAIIVACQQLDWFYSSSVVIFISILMIILNQIKAPMHDFSMYYDPLGISLEPAGYLIGSLFVILTATIMGLILLFQLSMSRRMRFGYHYRLQQIRKQERETARDIMMVQHNRIKDMEEAWHILPNEIAFDHLLAKGAHGEVWRGRLYRQSESQSVVVAIKKLRRTVDIFPGEDHPDDSEWIEDEAKLMMCLRHERLVSFIGTLYLSFSLTVSLSLSPFLSP